MPDFVHGLNLFYAGGYPVDKPKVKYMPDRPALTESGVDTDRTLSRRFVENVLESPYLRYPARENPLLGGIQEL